MMRLAVFFLIVALAAAGAVWLSGQSGSLTLNWQGYEIRLGVLATAVLAMISFIIVYGIIRAIKLFFAAPSLAAGAMRTRRREKGLAALSRGLIAASAGHGGMAERLGAAARRLLPDEPLTLLLEAQTAKLQGDNAAAQQVYRTMLTKAETQALGLHGLFGQARQAGDNAIARAIAERAVKLQPDSPWATPALMDLQSAEGDWVAAEHTLEKQKQHKLVNKKAANRQRAVLLTAQAMEREETGPDDALRLAQEAHKLAPDLVPAAIIAGRIMAQKDLISKAGKILEQTWKLSPHPDIADVYAHLRIGDKPKARLKRMQKLVQKNPDNTESNLALARAASDAREWGKARDALEPLLAAPSQRVCTLMAEIEDGEFGDKGKAREWLARALRAKRDPAWSADGVISQFWAPVSPVTGALDAFEWKVPVHSLPHIEPLTDMDMEPEESGQLPAVTEEIMDATAEVKEKPPQKAGETDGPAVVFQPPQPDDPGLKIKSETANLVPGFLRRFSS